ncbi:alpha/beta hydrolase [Natronorubrum sp. JWXQ-INN-674]|uniref:Alpha/beta hydrolase n=1 Tax=Natronorubrum halalkaliphilum TaxID=2691917 RepID=A0A6B0VQY3_9EURY|nr:alpha/beta hydrolase [Natronorubrum halalkaliphilum]MXV63192.1 alpha/beta hydrolase [Natronorubrum halalkaliphilum]
MTEHDPDGSDSAQRDENKRTDISRRRVLRTTAATAVGGAGLAGATGTASASGFTGCDDWVNAPAEYPELDLTSSNPSASNFDDIEDEDEDEDEFVVYVHGWRGLETSTDQAETLREALEESDYDGPVVAASWDADTLNYWRAESTTETAGHRLALWLASDRVDLEETTVRLVGHSLGGRVCLEALTALGGDATVESVALVGTAADDDAVCTDGQYAYGIDASAETVANYHSENDDAVCYGYDVQSLSSGLGCAGSDCEAGLLTDDSGSLPENYTDVDVTDEVAGHCDYIKPGVGCVPQLVDDFE